MADSVTLTGADLLAARVMWYSGALFWGLTLAVLPADWWKRLTV